VPFSPPIEFLQEELFTTLKKMGASFDLNLNRRGYFPKGNGLVSFFSKPARLPLKPIKLIDFGAIESGLIFSHCASLPKSVAENQSVSLKQGLASLGIDFEAHIECAEHSQSIGSGITVFVKTSKGAVLSGSALGAKGIPAENVGREAAENLLKELSVRKPCDSHLADQLIPFMALANGKSEINVSMLSSHCITNIAIVEKFFPVHFSVEGNIGNQAKISVEGVGFSAK
jgi:RNA 3'-phosphate cyclase